MLCPRREILAHVRASKPSRRGWRKPGRAGTRAACTGPVVPPAIRERFVVPVEYTVAFTSGVLRPDNGELVRALSSREPRRRHRVLVALDSGLLAAQPDLMGRVTAYASAHEQSIALLAPPLVVPGGERGKTDPTVAVSLVRWLIEHRLDRHAFLVAVGGGALLDVAGYAAATVHRGIRLVRLPTTVLSQADSGVGVKNGTNAFGKKNLLGTFAPPFAVIVDTSFLRTLDPLDTVAGYAEAVKVGLLKDAGFYRWIGAHADALARREPDAMDHLVHRSAQLHLEHIATSGDPFEQGSARPLDFGHWAAHKLEMLTGGRLRHGEAVAIGMVVDTHYAIAKGKAPPALGRSLLSTLSRLGLPTRDPALQLRDETGGLAVLAGLEEFREHLGGELRLVQVVEPGRMAEVEHVDLHCMQRVIEGLTAREAA
jgi:3-dehydroquinate synthase